MVKVTYEKYLHAIGIKRILNLFVPTWLGILKFVIVFSIIMVFASSDKMGLLTNEPVRVFASNYLGIFKNVNDTTLEYTKSFSNSYYELERIKNENLTIQANMKRDILYFKSELDRLKIENAGLKREIMDSTSEIKSLIVKGEWVKETHGINVHVANAISTIGMLFNIYQYVNQPSYTATLNGLVQASNNILKQAKIFTNAASKGPANSTTTGMTPDIHLGEVE
jgi:hypothetical protein